MKELQKSGSFFFLLTCFYGLISSASTYWKPKIPYTHELVTSKVEESIKLNHLGWVKVNRVNDMLKGSSLVGYDVGQVDQI
ncbi:hypothetical protein LAG90_05165 [Marinilongibacter aquaticus]|uniref:hypothetical protein n=1 Tax=Marinilongibacter aquaticus TaxID=2975157 RepID=UPI0021BDA551|nr:hypothetical protein [Marinilongibacter aquaticus]UBM60034.1 hypothetical protein LAG90_05165 [Marinilongibacter aquaticus]